MCVEGLGGGGGSIREGVRTRAAMYIPLGFGLIHPGQVPWGLAPCFAENI